MLRAPRAGRGRKGEHPQAHLTRFSGALQLDACAGLTLSTDAGKMLDER